MRWRSLTLAALLCAGTAHAEGAGSIVRVQRIEVLESPLRVRITGAFSGAAKGDAELTCPAEDDAKCREQWKRLRAGHCYEVGWDFAPPGSTKAVPWATPRGVRSVDLHDPACEALPGNLPVAPTPAAAVVRATDEAPPKGYHLETRQRYWALGTGIALAVVGSVIFINSTSAASDEGFFRLAVGVPMMATSVPFLALGFTSDRVFVRNGVSVVPVMNRQVAGAMLTLRF